MQQRTMADDLGGFEDDMEAGSAGEGGTSTLSSPFRANRAGDDQFLLLSIYPLARRLPYLTPPAAPPHRCNAVHVVVWAC